VVSPGNRRLIWNSWHRGPRRIRRSLHIDASALLFGADLVWSPSGTLRLAFGGEDLTRNCTRTTNMIGSAAIEPGQESTSLGREHGLARFSCSRCVRDEAPRLVQLLSFADRLRGECARGVNDTSWKTDAASAASMTARAAAQLVSERPLS